MNSSTKINISNELEKNLYYNIYVIMLFIIIIIYKITYKMGYYKNIKYIHKKVLKFPFS